MSKWNENLERMRIELRSAYKSVETEEYFDRIFTKPLGYLWAKLFMRLNWTPNMVTILSMALGFAGGWMLYPEKLSWNIAGILLVILADILDSTDGQMARLTGKSSELGRILDGLSTGAWYVAIYSALSFRLMRTSIPFTSVQWGWWIWVPVAISGLGGHFLQCLMADYYRTIHLFFLRKKETGELSRSADVKRKNAEMPRNTDAFVRLFYFGYYYYTRLQELLSPSFQRMMTGIEKKYGAEIPDEVSEDYLRASRRYVQLTNILTFNARAYTLFLLVLLNIPIWYFPIEIFLFGALLLYMLLCYRRICREMIRRYELA